MNTTEIFIFGCRFSGDTAGRKKGFKHLQGCGEELDMDFFFVETLFFLVSSIRPCWIWLH